MIIKLEVAKVIRYSFVLFWESGNIFQSTSSFVTQHYVRIFKHCLFFFSQKCHKVSIFPSQLLQVKSSDEAKVLCMTTIGNIRLRNKDFENVKVKKEIKENSITHRHKHRHRHIFKVYTHAGMHTATYARTHACMYTVHTHAFTHTTCY